MSVPSGPRYAFGPFRLEPEGQRLLRGGEEVALKPKVFDLLVLLVENRGRLLTKEALLEALWPRQVVEESNITQSIYELRKALADGGDATYVETVPRRGYRFSAEVTELGPEATGDAAAGSIRTIAVLPFVPLAGSERDESLELGLADTLIAALSRIAELTVRPAGSSRRFDQPRRDSLAAGRALKVEAVLDGTIQRAGGRLRVTPRLLRVPTGSVLWADKFDVPASDIFEVQDAICERVVRALELQLPGGAGAAMPRHTSDPEAHNLFLKCRHLWHKWTPDSWMRSIEYGRKALALDPAHAPSWSWIAASYVALGITGAMRPRDAFGHAAECVNEALKLDETLSEAHEVKGAIALFHDWDWSAADTALDRAVELNPSNAGARDLRALLRIVTGRPEEALREVEKALEVDPLSLLINTDVGFVNYYAGDFETAIAQLERTLELDPWFAHARLALGYAYLQTGNVETALAEFGAAVEYSGRNRETSPDLGYALAVTGRTGEAQDIFNALLERSTEVYTDPYSLALVQTGLGNADEAFKWLEKAVEERSRELIYLRANPVFRALEKDSRFSRIAERVGI